MKTFLIVFGLWFAVAWLPQIIKSMIQEAKIRKIGKKASNNDKWIYN